MYRIWRGMRTNKGQEDAYFTVEAALVFPMVLLFMTVMIFLAFYSYDRCVLEQSAYEAALCGAGGHPDDADAAYEAAAEAAVRLVQDRLLALHDLQYSVSVTPGKVSVSYTCQVHMPFLAWLGRHTAGTGLPLEVCRQAVRSRPVRTIRGYRIIHKLIPE